MFNCYTCSTVTVALVLEVNVDTYEGIAFYYDSGFGISENMYAIHNAVSGEFIAKVSTYDICKEKNVICPLHINEYRGYIPEDGDHIKYTQYRLGWRWKSWSSTTGINVVFAEKQNDTPYVEPKKLKFNISVTIHL